jgi:hypothetical protein
MQNILTELQGVLERNVGGRGSILESGKGVFYTPQRSDWLWRPPNLISYKYREFTPGDKTADA